VGERGFSRRRVRRTPSTKEAMRTTSLASAAYALWFIATRSDKDRLTSWGPDWGRRVVQRWFDAIMSLSGVHGDVRLELSEEELAEHVKRPCVVTCSPHGAFAIGFLCLHSQRLRNDPAISQFRAIPGGASVLFNLPLIRELLLLIDIRQASARTLDAAIRAGRSVALNTGGIWEQVCVRVRLLWTLLVWCSECGTFGCKHTCT
jgi:hypothetical protein